MRVGRRRRRDFRFPVVVVFEVDVVVVARRLLLLDEGLQLRLLHFRFVFDDRLPVIGRF